MSRFTPQPAVRKGQKARVALAGPSGSGKTYTALTLARSFGEKVLVLDTERGSSALYSDDFAFDVVEWVPPFDPRELAQVIAEQAGAYDVLIIDSLSHFWEGEGGTRDIVDAAAARSRGNSFAGWKEGTPAQDRMVQAIVSSPGHVICTMRAKTDYVLEERNGKQVPRKVGMAPIQRAGIDYEFTLTAELDHSHAVVIDKSRCRSLADRVFKPGDAKALGDELAGWLSAAEPAPPRISEEQATVLVSLMDAIADTDDRRRVKGEFVKAFGTPQLLDSDRFDDAKAWVEKQTAPEPVPEAPTDEEKHELQKRADEIHRQKKEREAAQAGAAGKDAAAGDAA